MTLGIDGSTDCWSQVISNTDCNTSYDVEDHDDLDHDHGGAHDAGDKVVNYDDKDDDHNDGDYDDRRSQNISNDSIVLIFWSIRVYKVLA